MKPVCKSCGSEDLSADATARWDVDTQNWELSGVFDSKTCDDCGYEKDYCNWVVLEEEEQDMDKDRRIQELLEANNRLVENNRLLKERVRLNTEQFQFYATNHRAKNTEDGTAKAIVNEKMVEDNIRVLTETSPR